MVNLCSGIFWFTILNTVDMFYFKILYHNMFVCIIICFCVSVMKMSVPEVLYHVSFYQELTLMCVFNCYCTFAMPNCSYLD